MEHVPRQPHRLSAEALTRTLSLFHVRREVVWFGLEGSFAEGGLTIVRYRAIPDGLLGGGGQDAINGAGVSAGFDAVAVLAGLGQYETDTVVTAELSVQFLALAKADPALRFTAWVTRAGSGSASCRRR